jgi:hypothetical protein
MRCGPKSLQHVLKTYRNIAISDVEADIACQLDPKLGTSPYNLADAFRGYNFLVDVKTGCTWEDLQRWHSSRYIIVLDYLDGGGKEDGHYVVLSDITDMHLTVWDSDINGTITWPRNSWRAFWLDFEKKEQGYELVERLAIVLKNATSPLFLKEESVE